MTRFESVTGFSRTPPFGGAVRPVRNCHQSSTHRDENPKPNPSSKSLRAQKPSELRNPQLSTTSAFQVVSTWSVSRALLR